MSDHATSSGAQAAFVHVPDSYFRMEANPEYADSLCNDIREWFAVHIGTGKITQQFIDAFSRRLKYCSLPQAKLHISNHANNTRSTIIAIDSLQLCFLFGEEQVMKDRKHAAALATLGNIPLPKQNVACQQYINKVNRHKKLEEARERAKMSTALRTRRRIVVAPSARELRMISVRNAARLDMLGACKLSEGTMLAVRLRKLNALNAPKPNKMRMISAVRCRLLLPRRRLDVSP